jgi:hypothetical protein
MMERLKQGTVLTSDSEVETVTHGGEIKQEA